MINSIKKDNPNLENCFVNLSVLLNSKIDPVGIIKHITGTNLLAKKIVIYSDNLNLNELISSTDLPDNITLISNSNFNMDEKIQNQIIEFLMTQSEEDFNTGLMKLIGENSLNISHKLIASDSIFQVVSEESHLEEVVENIPTTNADSHDNDLALSGDTSAI